MAKVTGIGGFFFRAKDPVALAAWYDSHLGIDEVPKSYDAPVWQQQAGPTVFAPFAADTEYFGRAEQQFMLNLRVDDLDGMIASLQAAGIVVERKEQDDPNGRFAWVNDPEGNRIELWEPKRQVQT